MTRPVPSRTFHNLSNSFRAVRLVALREMPRDADLGAGPFLVVQRGIDPTALEVEPRDFVLTRHGAWVPADQLLPLDWDTAERHVLFPVAAEVMELLARLPSSPVVDRAPVWPAPDAGTPPATAGTTPAPTDPTGFRDALLRALAPRGEP